MDRVFSKLYSTEKVTEVDKDGKEKTKEVQVLNDLGKYVAGMDGTLSLDEIMGLDKNKDGIISDSEIAAKQTEMEENKVTLQQQQQQQMMMMFFMMMMQMMMGGSSMGGSNLYGGYTGNTGADGKQYVPGFMPQMSMSSGAQMGSTVGLTTLGGAAGLRQLIGLGTGGFTPQTSFYSNW